MDRQQEEIQKSFEALEAKSVKSTRASAAGAVNALLYIFEAHRDFEFSLSVWWWSMMFHVFEK